LNILETEPLLPPVEEPEGKFAMAGSERRTKKGPRLMTVSEISKYLRVHPTTVYRLAKAGELPGFKIGDSWRFDPERIDRWLHQRAKESEPK
jgi:excisionase family DNA binding protein